MKILLVSDHALSREGMRHILKQMVDDVVVLEAGDCSTALDLAKKHSDLDIVLLELNLPGASVLSALSELRERHPSLRVVILSASVDANQLISAFNQGAMGYIPKTASSQVMLSALRLVYSGGTYIPPEFLACNGSQITMPKAKEGYSDSGQGSAFSPFVRANLTLRQAQVFAQLVQGKPNKMIARELDIAMGTVKTHVTAILRALNVTNRTQAVVVAGGARDLAACTAPASQSHRRWNSWSLAH